MPHISPTRNKSAGFTLVEMLAIAPIIVIVLAVFIGLMINMTGDVLASSMRNKLVYDVNQAFDQMDTDVKGAVLFPSTSFTPAAGQGLDFTAAANSTAYVSGSSPFQTADWTIILREVATDKSPLDPSHTVVYKKNADGSCSTSPYLYDIVYFFANDPSASDTFVNVYGENQPLGKMYRRVLFDTASTPCTTPYQKPTCQPGVTGTNCLANDEEWGTEGYGLYQMVWYYAGIPDTTTDPWHGQDWIHPYKDGTSGCTSDPPADVFQNPNSCTYHFLDPYSPTTGQNAKSIYIMLGAQTTVAGKTVSLPSQVYYGTRGGN